ncbi:MAG: hypothetical protein ACKV1O_04945 [Saprospiraceae bacterium]
MKRTSLIAFLFLLLAACNSNSEVSNHCSCPIPENVDIKIEEGTQTAEKERGFEAKSDIEAAIKKAVDAKISISGSYSNSETKIEEVYKEIKGSNPQITQNANFYRSIACAYYEIACQDKSLDEKEKRDRLNEIVAGYELNIHKIINGEEPKKQIDDTQNNSITSNKEAKIARQEQQTVKQPVKIQMEKSISYSSIVKDENGKGIANIEIYCPNCIVKHVKTKQNGSFHLEGYFDETSTFWQSTLTFSNHNKSKTETIDWREKSPEPINF